VILSPALPIFLANVINAPCPASFHAIFRFCLRSPTTSLPPLGPLRYSCPEVTKVFFFIALPPLPFLYRGRARDSKAFIRETYLHAQQPSFRPSLPADQFPTIFAPTCPRTELFMGEQSDYSFFLVIPTPGASSQQSISFGTLFLGPATRVMRWLKMNPRLIALALQAPPYHAAAPT